jgi:ATP-dependent DNA helicase RecG
MVDALKTDFYRASHRNKLLAEGFYLSGEVEKYGTGFVRIRERLMKEAPDLQLAFREESGAFWVTLARASVVQEKALAKTSQKASQKTSQKTSQKILEGMVSDPSVTIAALAEECNVSTRAIKYHIKRLQEEGRIRRIGPDKGGRWALGDG